MEPNPRLIDELSRAKVERARAMSPAGKVLAGPRLLEQACRVMADGIRDEHLQASEEEVRRILTERLAL